MKTTFIVPLLVSGCVVILYLQLVLLMLYRSNSRTKKAYRALQQANLQLQAQHTKISLQEAEIAEQVQQLQVQNALLAQHHSFKDKLFSVISHDLRTPISSLKGILDLVQVKPMKDNEVKHVFGLLSKEMDLVMNMLTNVLDWAKAQQEGDRVTLEPVSIQQLVEENIQLSSSPAEDKNILLHHSISADVMALVDRERLNFIVRNLLMNAIKFTYAGGEVMVSVQEQEGRLVLSVTDNGVGIRASDLTSLFTGDRFTTLGTAREKGTGLGLMLSREFVESLEGTIGVESEEGKGTTFLVTLPKATSKALQTKEAAVLI